MDAPAGTQDRPETETDICRLIAAGELPSPQRVGGFMLWCMRVTGSGWAQRPALNELTYRPPETFVTPEMAERCAGLPVCVGHPEDGRLDSTEFAARIVGTVALAYVKGSEIWAICRVYDNDVNQALASGEMSTSPSAIFRAADVQQVDLPGGGHVVIEGTPAILDHLAVVPLGTWDKGATPRGVRADSAVSTERKSMSESMMDTAPDATAAVLEKVLGSLTDTLARLDAMASKMDAYCSKVDAMAAGQRDPGAPPDTPVLTAADSARPAPKTLMQEREENRQLADAQARADATAVEFGQRAPAPMVGETPLAFRRRLLRPYVKYSDDFKSVDIDAISDPAVLDIAETRIFADAITAARNCAHLPDAGPHPVTRTDPTGRRIVEWKGKRTFIAAMKPTTKRAKFIRPNFANDQAS